MACFCRDHFGISQSESCDQGGERPLRHRKSGCGGGGITRYGENVDALMDSGQVHKIEVTRFEHNGQYGFDLSFETFPGTCASQLGYYLLLQD